MEEVEVLMQDVSEEHFEKVAFEPCPGRPDMENQLIWRISNTKDRWKRYGELAAAKADGKGDGGS